MSSVSPDPASPADRDRDSAARRPRGRGRPRIPTEVQRRRLLDGALRAFQSGEYERTTVADIVAEAGMSSRSFYEHFDSKEDLVVELIHEAGRALLVRLEEMLADTRDPQERLDRGLGATLEAFASTPVDLSRMGDAAPLRVMAARRGYVHQISEIVLRATREAFERGQTSREPDRIAVEVLVSGLEALAARYVLEGRAHELAALRPGLVELVARAWF